MDENGLPLKLLKEVEPYSILFIKSRGYESLKTLCQVQERSIFEANLIPFTTLKELVIRGK